MTAISPVVTKKKDTTNRLDTIRWFFILIKDRSNRIP
jgi:hypothetical protein